MKAATAGIADSKYGQEIIIEARRALQLDKLMVFRSASSASTRYKTPKAIKLVGELSKDPSGKVQRLRLLEI